MSEDTRGQGIGGIEERDEEEEKGKQDFLRG
jgi:hypothetical protein